VAIVSILLLSPVVLLNQYSISVNFTDAQSGLLGIVFFVYLIVWVFFLYSLMFALPVIVVEDIVVQEATRIALRFNRHYFLQILGVRVLVGLIPSRAQG
jgi:membrane-anchored glycerophosphoryl diester phosphodiesterase (GDPDase)